MGYASSARGVLCGSARGNLFESAGATFQQSLQRKTNDDTSFRNSFPHGGPGRHSRLQHRARGVRLSGRSHCPARRVRPELSPGGARWKHRPEAQPRIAATGPRPRHGEPAVPARRAAPGCDPATRAAPAPRRRLRPDRPRRLRRRASRRLRGHLRGRNALRRPASPLDAGARGPGHPAGGSRPGARRLRPTPARPRIPVEDGDRARYHPRAPRRPCAGSRPGGGHHGPRAPQPGAGTGRAARVRHPQRRERLQRDGGSVAAGRAAGGADRLRGRSAWLARHRSGGGGDLRHDGTARPLRGGLRDRGRILVRGAAGRSRMRCDRPDGRAEGLPLGVHSGARNGPAAGQRLSGREPGGSVATPRHPGGGRLEDRGIPRQGVVRPEPEPPPEDDRVMGGTGRTACPGHVARGAGGGPTRSTSRWGAPSCRTRTTGPSTGWSRTGSLPTERPSGWDATARPGWSTAPQPSAHAATTATKPAPSTWASTSSRRPAPPSTAPFPARSSPSSTTARPATTAPPSSCATRPRTAPASTPCTATSTAPRSTTSRRAPRSKPAT